MYVCFIALTGCLERPALDMQTFSFNEPEKSAVNVMSGGRLVGIRSFQIASPFDSRSLVYRTGDDMYVRDPYAEFLDLPADVLIAPVGDWLRKNGAANVDNGSDNERRPNVLVDISMSRLYGDFRRPEHPLAVMSMRFSFYDVPMNATSNVIYQKEYVKTVPIGASSATALMHGWNVALNGILIDVYADLAIAIQINKARQNAPHVKSGNAE
jgi:hypothetical protein